LNTANPLLSFDAMAARIAENVPGAVPDIRSDGDTVVYRMKIVGATPALHLVIRCTREGTVSASIVGPSNDTA
jgi:hypothetical protein